MRRTGVLLGVLSALVVAACGDDAALPAAVSTCPPRCAAPAQAGDAGSANEAGATPEAPGMSDAGAPSAPPAPRDGGTPAALDAATASMDATTNRETGAESGTSAGDAHVGAVGRDAGASPVLPPVSDYAKPGPFKTTTQANVGPGSGYTVFRPEPLGADNFVHTPIIFGPGILTDASFYSAFLTHLASHGFVTISVNSMSGGPGAAANLTAMKSGLDWLIAQNAQAGSYQGKLAVDRAVAMGYSIGATASVELSSHPAVATTVVIHGHNTKGEPHGPVLMITGTSDVIDDMRKTQATLEEAPAILVALPIGHLDVLTELAMLTTISPSARYIAPITAWLRYWAHADQTAKRFFAGSDCEMCKSPWIPPEPNAKWNALSW